MKKLLIVATLAAGLAGCNSNDPQDRAAVGGAVGALTGAGVAAAAGANTGTTLAAAAGGGILGAAAGSATAPRRRCVNTYGEPVPCPPGY